MYASYLSNLFLPSPWRNPGTRSVGLFLPIKILILAPKGCRVPCFCQAACNFGPGTFLNVFWQRGVVISPRSLEKQNMDFFDDMKLKLSEVARRLDLPADTVERWIRQGRIPLKKTGHECIFKTSTLEKWAGKHNLVFRLPQESRENKKESRSEGLFSAMTRGGIFYHLAGRDVESALTAATEMIPSLSDGDKIEVLEKLIERERLTSTGIGKGIAIPHPRTPLSGEERLPSITTCFLEKEISYDAVDDQPVFVLFILLAPSVQSHLNLLSRLSYCVREDSFVKFIMGCPDKGPFLEKIIEMEKKLEKSQGRVV